MLNKIFIIFLLIPSFLQAAYPHKANSVLKDGKWYRISLVKQGIYKITYDDLVKMGFDVATLDPTKISIYGNGGGMLPESNAIGRADDLTEIPLDVHDGGDGKMNKVDYVLFYGESPDVWNYDYLSYRFSHHKNLYSDSTYYYVTIGNHTGKRVQEVPSLQGTPANYSSHFTDLVFHEIDSVNLNQSGKTWVGETFSNTKTKLSFSYSFPNTDNLSSAIIVTHVLSKSTQPSFFELKDDRGFIQRIHFKSLDPQNDTFAYDSTKTSYLVDPKSIMNFTLSYNISEASAVGWLDYVEIACPRKLRWTGPMMPFRDAGVIPSTITRFTMSGTNPSVLIWDVTHPAHTNRIIPVMMDSTLWFQAATDSLKEFIAFDGSAFLPVTLSGPVQNQNLHGLSPTNLVIITPKIFRQQADSLAQFHMDHNQLTVSVVDLDQIFTEFGCGERDVTAVRDFMKMLYDKGQQQGSAPRYLLLFGDGTYDPKNRIAANDNFVPPYESNEYISVTGSYVSDDYFGILGDNEGNSMNGSIDVGIGRLPVNNVQQARDVIHKIFRYSTLNDSTLADWKNTITLVADDPNENLHLQQAERLADTIKSKYPVFNIKKIYNDAFRFVRSPSGLRSPDCEKTINQVVAGGTVVFSYTGHGGEDGWSGTKILTVNDINNWTNNYRLPVFLTATCEFGRFDNPGRPTGGELVLTKPDGGGIAIFTTTRKAFATENILLAASFFSHLKSIDGSENQRMGDLMRTVKNENGNNLYIRNFVLLGDPAQDIAFPVQQAVTTSINGKKSGVTGSDTLTGMSKVTIKGEIRNSSGNKLVNYNGLIFPRVFDKPVTYTTIGNTSESYPQKFRVQDKILFSGKTTVTNGDFEFSFVVPRDIAIQYGFGKISYYSHDSITDANGFDSDIVIGGMDPSGEKQVNGPAISLYMDNTRFISGGMTGKDPLMLAYLNDEVGISCYGLGIGHDLTAVIDNDEAHPIILNDYYEADTNSYTSGRINYAFYDLNPGLHSLRLKAWNVFDISSEKEIFFWISGLQAPTVQKVSNVPNPLRTDTKFVFSSTTVTGDVDVEIQIYSYTGALVKTIRKRVTQNSGELQVIPWDGTSDNGLALGNGIYPYRIIMKGLNGEFAQASMKVMIMR